MKLMSLMFFLSLSFSASAQYASNPALTKATKTFVTGGVVIELGGLEEAIWIEGVPYDQVFKVGRYTKLMHKLYLTQSDDLQASVSQNYIVRGLVTAIEALSPYQRERVEVHFEEKSGFAITEL